MEYTELADYPLPAGVVTEWTPTAEEGDWTTDDRRLSYAHLEHARRAVEIGDDWHSEWIGTAFRIGHRLDRDAMATTLRRWYARHEAFRSALDHTRDVAEGEPAREDEFTRRIIAADKVDVAARRDAEPSSSTRVYLRVDHIFNTRINPLRWPHCLVVTVEPTDDAESFLLVFGADHTVMDAYTQVFAIKELTRLYEAALTGRDDSLGVFGSYLDFSHAERDHGSRLDRETAEVTRWAQFLSPRSDASCASQPDPMPAFPVAPDVDHDDVVAGATLPPYQSSLSRWLLDPEQTDRFNRACKALGANMQAGIHTALCIANQRVTGCSDLRFISPVHTRTELQWGEAAGWFVGLVPVHLRPGAADTFGAAIGPVAETSREHKELGTVPFHPIAELIGHRTPPQFVVSYIDLRGAEGADAWDEMDARVLRSATRSSDEVYFWINRINTGTNLSARFPSTHPGATRVHRFLRAFEQVLLEVVERGDTTFAEPQRTVGAGEPGSVGGA
ncbi:MAG: peptide synthase [Williamsia herbipolensis]|uniref:Condensation domain-containing protein n=1 Tax=Williamsia serinedens TaxID=391736 RepID=A0ABT1H183_9NOCA|nr:condensation domain-containing protein [Williamsia serinedens]MBE7160402.1 peptide synthase [Williamsia herbipolensis]MCP2160308.1 Condensation domain-containing protein [Williamsia serinedens]